MIANFRSTKTTETTRGARLRWATLTVAGLASVSALLATPQPSSASPAMPSALSNIIATKRVHDYFSPGGEKLKAGDVNGDGIDDFVTARSDNTGDLWVAFMNRSGNIASTRMVDDYFSPNAEKLAIGDVNGDGVDDLVTAVGGTSGDVWVAYMNRAGGVASKKRIHDWFSPHADKFDVGDMNGDGVEDIITASANNEGDVWVGFMNRNGDVTTTRKVHDYFAPNAEKLAIGDMNGDGVDDLVSAVGDASGDVWVAFMDRNGNVTRGAKVHDFFAPLSEKFRVGDMNGDGVDDLVTAVGDAGGDVWVSYMNRSGQAGAGTPLHDFFSPGPEKFVLGDFDGSGSDDLGASTGGTTADLWVALTVNPNQYGGPYGRRIVEIATAELNRPVRESAPNTGTRINEYQRTTGTVGLAWCASFTSWLGIQAGDPTPFKSAGVAAWYSAASARSNGLSFVARADVRPGDLIVFEWRGGTNFAAYGHIGVVTSRVGSDNYVATIEGNIRTPDGREGVDAMRRLATATTVKGFIRINS